MGKWLLGETSISRLVVGFPSFDSRRLHRSPNEQDQALERAQRANQRLGTGSARRDAGGGCRVRSVEDLEKEVEGAPASQVGAVLFWWWRSSEGFGDHGHRTYLGGAMLRLT